MTKILRAIGAALVAYAIASTIGGSRSTEDAVPDASQPAGAMDRDAAKPGLRTRIDRIQKRLAPVAFAHAVIKKYGEDGGGRLAATVAYYAFFSVFPAMLALAAIAGFVLDRNEDLRRDLVDTAVGQFPVVGDSIADASLSGSGVALAVGVAGAVWAGLGAMLASQHALNTVWDVPWHDRPDPVSARFRGLLMFVVIALGLVLATVLTNLVTEAPLPAGARVGIVAANVAVNVGLAYLSFQILTAEHVRWSELWPGAVAAGVGFYVLQTTGSLVVRRYVASASDTYGTFALVIGLLSWFHIASQLTLISAEINVVRSRRLWPRTLFGDDLTEGDRRAFAGFRRAAARHEQAAQA